MAGTRSKTMRRCGMGQDSRSGVRCTEVIGDRDLSRPAATESHTDRPSPTSRFADRVRKLVLLGLAAFFFALGVLGVLLPGLPATPFLLLTSYFLVRCSPALNAMLLRSRLFGPILVDWQVHGGIRKHVRIRAIMAVAAAVGMTAFLSQYSLWPTIAVTLAATLGIVVILRLPAAR